MWSVFSSEAPKSTQTPVMIEIVRFHEVLREFYLCSNYNEIDVAVDAGEFLARSISNKDF